MKFPSIFAAGALALALAGTAQAQTIVRFTGSTAYRSQTNTAIRNSFDTTPSPVVYGYNGTSFTGANTCIFYGFIGGVETIVKTSFNGSEAGIKAVSAQQNVSFFPGTTNAVVGTYSLTSGGTTGLTGATNPEVPDVSMSDTTQSTSAYNGLYKGVTYPALSQITGGLVGIVPFKWVAQVGAPVQFANITAQNIRSMYNGQGKLPLSMMTGDNADQGTIIVATGRDPDSGTRLTAFAESGLGAQATVTQFQPLRGGAQVTAVGGVVDAASYTTQWPASTVNGIAVAQGNGGYSSGGQLAGALGSPSPNNNYFVTYLGTSDANVAITAGARELSYNGSFLGGNSATDYNSVQALTEGRYTFWGYERMYTRSGSSIRPIAVTIATTIRALSTTVRDASMQVQRSSDGGIVTTRVVIP